MAGTAVFVRVICDLKRSISSDVSTSSTILVFSTCLKKISSQLFDRDTENPLGETTFMCRSFLQTKRLVCWYLLNLWTHIQIMVPILLTIVLVGTNFLRMGRSSKGIGTKATTHQKK
jgi:galactitol-specific phosphotransferase system IIC component